MRQDLKAGDFLLFQLEAGYGLLRLLAVEGTGDDVTWHVASYSELFLDIDMAEHAAESGNVTSGIDHVALTNRAFESTQVSRLISKPLTESDLSPLHAWAASADRSVSDRSIRLLMGLR